MVFAVCVPKWCTAYMREMTRYHNLWIVLAIFKPDYRQLYTRHH